LLKSLRWIILIYGVLCGLFYTYQQYFYFKPKTLDAHDAYSFKDRLKYNEVSLPFDSATIIDIIKFLPEDSVSKGVVLFFHGNRFNVEHYSSYAPYFTKHGYECWMPDYPGYGRSTGEMNIDILQKLSIQLYKMARVNYRPDQIIIYGKSLGTGIAAYLASMRDCRALILETPYHSLSSLTGNYLFFMPVHLLIKYNIDTYKHFQNITAPITAMHGDKDELIPLSNALGLLNDMKPSDAFYIIPGGTHNTLPMFNVYTHVVDSVLNK
jgi:pimeloyl-ACP methyl ester carboxylesterase